MIYKVSFQGRRMNYGMTLLFDRSKHTMLYQARYKSILNKLEGFGDDFWPSAIENTAMLCKSLSVTMQTWLNFAGLCSLLN